MDADPSDAGLVEQAARVACEGNRTAFGRLLGHSDGRTVRAWLSGARGLTATDRLLLRVILAHPSVARWLAAAGAV